MISPGPEVSVDGKSGIDIDPLTGQFLSSSGRRLDWMGTGNTAESGQVTTIFTRRSVDLEKDPPGVVHEETIFIRGVLLETFQLPGSDYEQIVAELKARQTSPQHPAGVGAVGAPPRANS